MTFLVRHGFQQVCRRANLASFFFSAVGLEVGGLPSLYIETCLRLLQEAPSFALAK